MFPLLSSISDNLNQTQGKNDEVINKKSLVPELFLSLYHFLLSSSTATADPNARLSQVPLEPYQYQQHQPRPFARWKQSGFYPDLAEKRKCIDWK